MAERALLESFLSCYVCSETFTDPVSLSCNHSFCSSCLQKFWEQTENKNCPICKRRSSKEFPIVNLTLKQLADSFTGRQKSGSSEKEKGEKQLMVVCRKHSEDPKLFCKDMKRAVCPVCDISLHQSHKVVPIEQAVRELKEQLKSDLKPLHNKRNKHKQVEKTYNEIIQLSKKQVLSTEREIRAEFNKLHQLLKEEEESRLAALREEEKQKGKTISREMKKMQEQISSLSDSISAVEEALQKDKVSFLSSYEATQSRAQSSLPDPQLVPGALIDVAKHLGNLSFRVWEKMKEKVHFSPVILDPNTAWSRLYLSGDLTSVRQGDTWQQLPNNPERNTEYANIFGSEGFSSGTHSWEVEVGDHPLWNVGFVRESTERKGKRNPSPTNGVWCLLHQDQEYKTGLAQTLTLTQTPQKIRVQLDYEGGEVSFYDAEDMTHIYTYRDFFTEKLFPYLFVGKAGDAKTTEIKICKSQMLSSHHYPELVTINEHRAPFGSAFSSPRQTGRETDQHQTSRITNILQFLKDEEQQKNVFWSQIVDKYSLETMAERALLESFLSCHMCSETFTDPVSLSCNHSFCSSCVQKFWEQTENKNCPICKRRSSKEFPIVNLTLKALADSFTGRQKSGSSEKEKGEKQLMVVCRKHSEIPKLFCKDEQRAVCPVCDISLHQSHKVVPIEQAVSDLKEQLKSDFKFLQDMKKTYDDVIQHSKKQVLFTERQIRAEFNKLHQFLKEEEESRLAALREEEEQKGKTISREMKRIQEQISSLSYSISAVEEELQKDKVSFLSSYEATQSRARAQSSLPDPQLVPGALIDVAKHLGNLSFRVWEKMKEKVHFSPVILDPNTANGWLYLSDDLTSVRYRNTEQQLPDNPERNTNYFNVFGSEGFSSGTHSWEVEVGDHPKWTLGLVKESVERKGERCASPEYGIWCLYNRSGDYDIGDGKTLRVKKSLQRIRIHLDYDMGEVSFYDAEDMTHISTHKDTFTEKLYPYFFIGDAANAKTSEIKICETNLMK
ncbi:uncharacterized protein FYW61_020799 [Anableps anableps]